MASILIIDDDDHVRESVTAVLEQHGHRIAASASLRDARKRLKAGDRYELVLLDLWLSDGSGLQILSELVDAHPDRPVIVMSGGGAGQTLERALTLADIGGAADVLIKPFRNADLLNALEKALSPG